MRCEEARKELERTDIAAMPEVLKLHLVDCLECRGVQAIYAGIDEVLSAEPLWKPPMGFAQRIASQAVFEPAERRAFRGIPAGSALRASLTGLLVATGVYVVFRMTPVEIFTAYPLQVAWTSAIASLSVAAWFTRRALSN